MTARLRWRGKRRTGAIAITTLIALAHPQPGNLGHFLAARLRLRHLHVAFVELQLLAVDEQAEEQVDDDKAEDAADDADDDGGDFGVMFVLDAAGGY